MAGPLLNFIFTVYKGCPKNLRRSAAAILIPPLLQYIDLMTFVEVPPILHLYY